MDEVLFAPSAFRHGFAEEDLYELLAGHYLKIRSQRGLDDVYELLGQNFSGDYLHMVYRVLPDRRIRMFHMARMTESTKRRFQRTQR